VRGELYFAGVDDLSSAPSLYREGAALPSVVGIASLLSWPRYEVWEDAVALAFRDGASRAMIAFGDTASSLGDPIIVHGEPSAMANVAAFGDGSLAYVYQHPDGTNAMVSFIRRSPDAMTWSDPVRVTDASGNVHDTTLALRSDGSLDAYYAYPRGGGGFELHRRAITPDGEMGEEERVTQFDGEPTKPEVLRLASGRVLLAFADIVDRDRGTGEPTRQELTIASLPSEAPPP
jgi:hypothetical protein